MREACAVQFVWAGVPPGQKVLLKTGDLWLAYHSGDNRDES